LERSGVDFINGVWRLANGAQIRQFFHTNLDSQFWSLFVGEIDLRIFHQTLRGGIFLLGEKVW
jgi:hypothetical protein